MWLESNRPKHFLYAIPVALVGTILMAIGVAVGMEWKDRQWGGKFDWLDLIATVAGGLVGQGIQLFIIWKIWL